MPKTTRTKSVTTKNSSKNALPSIGEWLQDGWSLTKKVLVAFFGLSVLQFFVGSAVMIAGIVAAVVAVSVSGLANWADIQAVVSGNSELLPEVIGGLALGIGIVVAVLVAAGLYIGSAFQAAMIYLFVKQEKGVTVGEAFKFGFSKAWPIMLTSLLVLFFVFGGTLFFFIPGLVLSLLLMFASYEVVLGNKNAMAAIKGSYVMVSQFFWEILGRLVVLWLISVLIMFVWVSLDEIVKATLGEATSVKALLELLRFVYQFVFTALSMALMIRLYQAVKAAADPQKSVSMTWAWLVSAIGWVFLVMISSTLINVAKSQMSNPDSMQKLEESIESDMQYELQDL